MRQIKFRVWHKPTQTMHHYLKAKFGPNYMNITLEGKFKDVDQITSLTVPNNELEVMQFTGIYQNGIEVYEDDILDVTKQQDDYETYAQVVWDEDEAWWGYIKTDGDESEIGQLLAILDEDSKVIGNIYENPELVCRSN
jgi:uncharacterized phage protein (TIGR01671 family)